MAKKRRIKKKLKKEYKIGSLFKDSTDIEGRSYKIDEIEIIYDEYGSIIGKTYISHNVDNPTEKVKINSEFAIPIIHLPSIETIYPKIINRRS